MGLRVGLDLRRQLRHSRQRALVREHGDAMAPSRLAKREHVAQMWIVRRKGAPSEHHRYRVADVEAVMLPGAFGAWLCRRVRGVDTGHGAVLRSSCTHSSDRTSAANRAPPGFASTPPLPGAGCTS